MVEQDILLPGFGIATHPFSGLGEGEAMMLLSSKQRCKALRRKVTVQSMAAERKGPFTGHLTARHKKLTAQLCSIFAKKSFICSVLV